ncbi:MAG: type I-E CRISPR-associated protein Cas6/Cse3/CasE [Christensenellaceae bacterium]|jgi:CRISPR system Cascade subunit CasE|nr:type I-E CRISPR-associated protein Cas6/Cse3/CasE [Christensenellaceae bacterium]
MFLSRVEINPHLSKTMWTLASPQRMHAIVAASFPSAQDAEGRVLWRLDRLGPAQYILVQSSVKPDFTHLIEQLGWPQSGQQWETREYGSFLKALEEGQRWRFRLCANPTHSVKALGNGRRGKLLACGSANHQKEWLEAHAKRCGFNLTSFELIGRDLLRFQRKSEIVTLGVAVFEGTLEIESADTLRGAMMTGIGRAKAYGCGLLTLARVGE